jgi:Fe-S-cluster containining protein
MDLPHQIATVERKARQGEFGAWRKAFCITYREVSDRICRQAWLEQKTYLDSVGAAVTCHKGCSYCCSQYISVSLAHGLVIADYLYSHTKLLELFPKRYKKWLSAFGENSVLAELEKYTNFSYEVRRTPQELLDRYAMLEIPCPFLIGNACAIYPVRPICCASHVSVSPADSCRAGSADLAMISEATPHQEDLRELAMLGEPVLSFHQESMPSLVFRLLTEGLPEILRKLKMMAAGDNSARTIR